MANESPISRHTAMWAAACWLGVPMPQSPPDAPACDRCGVPMVLDACGDMWLCAHPLCGFDVPATPLADTGEQTDG